MKITIEINMPENLRHSYGVICEQKDRLLSELCNKPEAENNNQLITDIQCLHMAEEIMAVLTGEISRQECPFIYEEDMYKSPFCKIIPQKCEKINTENSVENLIKLLDEIREKLPETSFDRINLDVSKGIIEENAVKVGGITKAKSETEKLLHLYTKFHEQYKPKFGEEDALEEVYHIIRREVERNVKGK